MTLQQIADALRNKIEKFWDLEFPPNFRSVYDISIDSPLDVYVHWRRPNEFLNPNYDLGLLQPVVFQDSVEPSDIKPGILGNEWFLSALAILSERPALIERLFLTREMNEFGIYRIKFCKNGEW
jgi:calpain-15